MAMSMRDYLKDSGIWYEELHHPHEVTASRIAQTSHVAGHRLAKAVMLKGDGGYRLAVLPSTCKVDLHELSHMLRERIGLATEDEIRTAFADCDIGALPPMGHLYGMKVCLDDGLRSQSDIYFEAGDHETLIHMKGQDFERLMTHAERGQFGRHI
ncbi:aminoacyl-tRNA deacylase [Govanella unica]|uniref:YbaK/EbsC family protein n=1 Tax=Govanella unica TaxID=2975056 RepID=A0A9X3Z7K4_9PROT|nr:YbaK/EbsC family protein [Govania unica]MDA5194148.1 YbaK/EbsC family protein [Govania unica]